MWCTYCGLLSDTVTANTCINDSFDWLNDFIYGLSDTETNPKYNMVMGNNLCPTWSPDVRGEKTQRSTRHSTLKLHLKIIKHIPHPKNNDNENNNVIANFIINLIVTSCDLSLPKIYQFDVDYSNVSTYNIHMTANKNAHTTGRMVCHKLAPHKWCHQVMCLTKIYVHNMYNYVG